MWCRAYEKLPVQFCSLIRRPPPPSASTRRRFKAILRTDSGWDGIGYTCSFDTKDGEWQTVELPFSEFVPVFR